jgi:hypothetical protein
MDIVPTTNTTPWVERRWFGDEFNSPNFSGDVEWITQGPGDTSPSARITVGITSFTSGGIRDLVLTTFDGYSDTSPFTPNASQPNRALGFVHADEQAMDYHITINARRFIVGIRLTSGVWQSLYLGFFVPYAGTVSYPYPIVNGGTDTVNAAPSSVAQTHSSWWDPSTTSNGNNGSLRIREPAGGYQVFWNREADVVSDTDIDNVVWPYGQTSQVNSAEFHNIMLGGMARTVVFRLGTSPDPDLRAYNLLQTVLFTLDFAGGIGQTLGFLDGVFHITAEANAGGNTFVLESPEVTYLVLQNVFKTARRDMVAIRMDP